MGKKKTKEDSDEVEIIAGIGADDIEDAIIKEYGNILLSGNSIKDARQIVIPVSPAINIGIGGGVPEGTWFVLTGKPKVGKTTTALHFAVKAQQLKYANPKLCPEGRRVYYLNVEGRIKERDLEGFPGLDMSRFKMIQSEPGNILNAEKYLSIAEKLITSVPGCVIIIDSYSALCTEAEMVGSMSDQQRADGAKLLAKFCRKMANIVPVNRCIIVGITHIMSDPSGLSKGDREKSGNAVAFQADIKIWGKWGEEWKLGEKQIGQKAHWDVKFSAIGPPGAKVISLLRYGIGIDEESELAQMIIDMGFAQASGAWYGLTYLIDAESAEFKDLPPKEKKKAIYDASKKCQGLEGLRRFLIDNPDEKKKIESQIYDMMGIKQC